MKGNSDGRADLPLTPYFRRLLEIARKNRVQVHLIPSQHLDGLEWDGLYLVDSGMGAGIAIRAGLETAWRDWILGHELGHHFGNLNGTLFSPFRAHSVNRVTRQRWGEWRKLDPDEEQANEWAANALIDAKAWEAAERRSPCNLEDIAASLRLPPVAAVAWERLQRKRPVSGRAVDVPIDSNGWQILERSLSGVGGHQAFFRRLASRRSGSNVRLTFRDFSLARERVLRVSGGWLTRYDTLLNAVSPMVTRAGSVRALFGG